MPQFQASTTEGALSSIEFPRCPHCQARMMLESISPAPRGYDLRTFDCAKCDRISTRLVPRDPMKNRRRSAMALWRAWIIWQAQE
jgi:hypothetical protein